MNRGVSPVGRIRTYASKFLGSAKETSDHVDKLASVGVAFGLGDPTGTTLTVAAAVSVAAKAVSAVAGMAKLVDASDAGGDTVLRQEMLILLVANEAYLKVLAEALADEAPEIKSAIIPGSHPQELLDIAKAETAPELLRGRSKLFELYEGRLSQIQGPDGQPVVNREKFARRVTEQAVKRMSFLLTRSDEPYRSLQTWLINEAIAASALQTGKPSTTERTVSVAQPVLLDQPESRTSSRQDLDEMIERLQRIKAELPRETSAKVASSGPGEVSVEFQASKAIFEAAKALLDGRKVSSALPLFQRVAKDLEKETAPDAVQLRARALGNTGHCYHRMGHPKEAARFFREGYELAPTLIRLRVNGAIADLHEGRIEKGEAALRALLQERPEEPDVVELLAEALTRRNADQDAVDLLLAHPRKSENYFCLLSMAYGSLGERKKALEAAREGIAISPDADYAEFCAGVVLAEDVLRDSEQDTRFKQDGVVKLRQAKKHVARALELVRNEDSSPLLRVYLVNLSAICGALREPEEALKYAEEARALGELDRQGLVNVFAAQMGMKKVDDAVETARELRKHEPLADAVSRELHAYLVEDRYEDIVTVFDTIVRDHVALADEAELLALRIYAQRMQPDVLGAELALHEALRRLGRVFPLVLEEAELLDEKKDYAGAERAFAEAERIAVGQQKHGCRVQRGMFHYRRRQYADALLRLVAPDEEPLMSPVLVEYLITLTQLNRLAEVATIGLEAIKVRKFSGNLYGVTASALQQLGRLKEAENVLRQLVRHDGSAENHVMLGQVCFRRKNGLGEATKVLESGRSRHPDSFLIHVNLSGLYFAARKYRDAFLMAKRAREISPDRKEGHQAMLRMLMTGEELKLSEDEKRLVQESITKAEGLTRLEMKMKPDGQLDLSEVMVVLKERHDHVQDTMKLYREKRLPVSILSELVGRPLVETWLDLTRSVENRIYCASGTTAEQIAEQALAEKADAIAVDATALLTLQALGLLKRLPRLFEKIHVATSTHEKLQEEMRELESVVGQSGTIAYHEGRIHLSESGEESRKARESILRPVLSFVESNEVTIEGMDNVSWEAWQKLAQLKTLPEWVVAPALLAKAKSCAYYGDELAMRLVASERDGTRGFSVQAVLRVAHAKSVITTEEYDSAVIRLVAINYDFISLSVDILVAHFRRTRFVRDDVAAKIFRQLEASHYTDEKSSHILGALAAVVWFETSEPGTPSREEWMRACIASLNVAQSRSAALVGFLAGTIPPLIDFPEALSALYLHLESRPELSLEERTMVRAAADNVFATVVERLHFLSPRQRASWEAMLKWKRSSRFTRRPLS